MDNLTVISISDNTCTTTHMEQIIATAKQQEYQHYNYTYVSQTAISSTEKEEPTSKGNQKELSTGIPKIIQQRYIDTVQPMTKEAHWIGAMQYLCNRLYMH